ncbi:TIGR02253 family HAD-type hydrolase [archaeon]|nr:MAG: TIGR02253 family HAD-type hydrolase [archaeon]
MISTVFFDLDDTLHNTTRLARLARNAAVHAMIDQGLPLTPEGGCKKLVEIVRRKGSNYPGHFDLLVEETIGEKNYRLIAAGIIGYHNTKFANMHPYSDTVSTLIELKKMGMEVNIISNGRSLKQWEKILRLGLESFFTHVLISETVGYSKPDRKMFETALSIAHCDASDAVFVDDRVEYISGARECGMHTICMDKHRREPHDAPCDFIVHSLSEIPPLIRVL